MSFLTKLGLITLKQHKTRINQLLQVIDKLRIEISLDNSIIDSYLQQVKDLSEPRVDLDEDEIQSMIATLVAGHYE